MKNSNLLSFMKIAEDCKACAVARGRGMLRCAKHSCELVRGRRAEENSLEEGAVQLSALPWIAPTMYTLHPKIHESIR